MSKLDGHRAITNQAVKEIMSSCETHPLAGNLRSVSLPQNVVNRDILDVLTLGHWADFGQKHHFMRRFDGQSPDEAYKEGVEWIRSNAIRTSKLIAKRIQLYMSKVKPSSVAPHAGVRMTCNIPVFPGGNNAFSEGRKVLGGTYYNRSTGSVEPNQVNWQPFGNALHALQDSFSLGHVIRDQSDDQTIAGPIEYIKIYAGEEVKDHGKYDRQWGDTDPITTFTALGRLAVEASKELITIILKSAQVGSSVSTKSDNLMDWNNFVNKWLVASIELSTVRNFAIDFIERFEANIQLGNSNIKTTNMDEEGMAAALITECATNTQNIYEVFKRLDEHYNSDVDNIAKFYINKVKTANAAISEAIGNNKKLVDLLIKVMDEGYTTGSEKAAIEYLKSL